MVLLIDLTALVVRRVRVRGVNLAIAWLLIHLLGATRILTTTHLVCTGVGERRKLRARARWINLACWCLSAVVGTSVNGWSPHGLALAVFLGLSSRIFLLLARFPFLADLLEFCTTRSTVSVFDKLAFIGFS